MADSHQTAEALDPGDMPVPILFLINTLGAGGAERQLLYLISGLDRDRFAPVVCTVFDEATYPSHPAHVEQLRALDVPLHTLGHGAGWPGRIADPPLCPFPALGWR